MQRTTCVCLAVAGALWATSVMAEGRPTPSKLSKLGLSSLQVVSDQQGEAVRGRFLATGGILTLGTATVGRTTNGSTISFPSIAAQTYIAGNAPRPLGNTVFGVTGFGMVSIATSANGNPTFSGFNNVPTAVSVTDTSGTATISVQFWSFSAGN